MGQNKETVMAAQKSKQNLASFMQKTGQSRSSLNFRDKVNSALSKHGGGIPTSTGIQKPAIGNFMKTAPVAGTTLQDARTSQLNKSAAAIDSGNLTPNRPSMVSPVNGADAMMTPLINKGNEINRRMNADALAGIGHDDGTVQDNGEFWPKAGNAIKASAGALKDAFLYSSDKENMKPRTGSLGFGGIDKSAPPALNESGLFQEQPEVNDSFSAQATPTMPTKLPSKAERAAEYALPYAGQMEASRDAARQGISNVIARQDAKLTNEARINIANREIAERGGGPTHHVVNGRSGGFFESLGKYSSAIGKRNQSNKDREFALEKRKADNQDRKSALEERKTTAEIEAMPFEQRMKLLSTTSAAGKDNAYSEHVRNTDALALENNDAAQALMTAQTGQANAVAGGVAPWQKKLENNFAIAKSKSVSDRVKSLEKIYAEAVAGGGLEPAMKEQFELLIAQVAAGSLPKLPNK